VQDIYCLTSREHHILTRGVGMFGISRVGQRLFGSQVLAQRWPNNRVDVVENLLHVKTAEPVVCVDNNETR
ncbi:MAG: hypothetical protein WBX07_08710, partial [Rhodoplanes sp.]